MKLFCSVLLVAFCLLGVACKRSTVASNSNTSQGGKRLEFHGKVTGVDKERKEVSVAHDDVKEADGVTIYMPAMTMPFPLHDEWAFSELAPGDEVSATLVIVQDQFWLEGIAISKAVNGPGGSQPDASSLGIPEPGTPMPNATLVNQDGKKVALASYRGKVLILTFLYTRCPLPQFCSLMASNFVQIDKQLQKDPDHFNRTHLLSITIDPDGDTPTVLRTYGESLVRRDDKVLFDHWEFLTGIPDEIRKAATFFGLDYFPEKGQITHSLRTAIIAPDGKVYRVYKGNQWRVEELQADLNRLLDGAGK
jgi:protein SCO1/2